MDNDFIHLENDLILNIDKMLAIVKNTQPTGRFTHTVIYGGSESEIGISQKDYDAIKDYLFGFHPNYGSEAKGEA